ncbi:MAG: hypothetical protein IPJ65_16020 [Archangiaceae bacterium]|nr:hypothetical protein [Archangiaceae bacterium]
MAAEAAQLELPKPVSSSLFISTPLKDFLFYFLSVTVVLIAWFAATIMHVNSFYILATVVWWPTAPTSSPRGRGSTSTSASGASARCSSSACR